MKAWSSVDCVISVIVKTVFVLMLLFDIGKYVGQKYQKYSPKNKCFFSSFNNDRGLSLDEKTNDYVNRNNVGLVHSSHEVT